MGGGGGGESELTDGFRVMIANIADLYSCNARARTHRHTYVHIHTGRIGRLQLLVSGLCPRAAYTRARTHTHTLIRISLTHHIYCATCALYVFERVCVCARVRACVSVLVYVRVGACVSEDFRRATARAEGSSEIPERGGGEAGEGE